MALGTHEETHAPLVSVVPYGVNSVHLYEKLKNKQKKDVNYCKKRLFVVDRVRVIVGYLTGLALKASSGRGIAAEFTDKADGTLFVA